MKAEAQRIAIALLMGAYWTVSRERLGYPEALLVMPGYTPSEEWDVQQEFDDPEKCEKRSVHHSVPWYPDSLDAMHEAEKVLTNDQRATYVNLLAPTGYAIQVAVMATTPQRAEALLRTLDLWKP